MVDLETQQRRLEQELNDECHECGSTDLRERYYRHDGSLKGYACRDCEEWQQKIILVKGETCDQCESFKVRKMFDTANRWVMNKCLNCGDMV
jgi:hypothetical protein